MAQAALARVHRRVSAALSDVLAVDHKEFVMALLDPSPYPLPPLGPHLSERFDAHQKAFDDLADRSAALPDGDIVGALLSWPVADGQACYVVVDAEPLTVQHVPYMDAWTVDPIMIKGLDADDVRAMLARQKALAALFKRA